MINLKEYKRIHCIGIGGIGLSAIAEILLERGYEVTGSDMNDSAMVDKLRSHGATVYIGHNKENIENVDLIVYTVAVSDDNPELAGAKELGIPAITRAQMLGLLMDEYNYSVAVSGTHGKTTTTSMVSLVLRNAKLEPTILIGGNLREIDGNVEAGNSQYFVTEACEYRDSFLQLRPKIEILLNIDSDHLDYFKDINHIVKSFETFAGLVPEDGAIVAYAANPFVNSVVKDLPNVITFGLGSDSTYYGSDVEFVDGMPCFTVNHEGRALGRVKLSVPGEHNVLNSLAAFACCHMLGVDVDIIISTLESYSGTARRFENRGEIKGGARIIDDYAHHPTEIGVTLKAAANLAHKKIWGCFQPHTYTRTKALFEEFAGAFTEADEIVLAKIYPAREKDIYNISSIDLMERMKKDYPEKKISCFETLDMMAEYVYENAEAGDIIMTMGAGDITTLGDRLLALEIKGE